MTTAAKNRLDRPSRARVRVARVTTEGFAALADHTRLPARFFGRFTASVAKGAPAD